MKENSDYSIAFRTLYTETFKSLCAYVRWKFPSLWDDAENIVQDAFVTVFEQNKDISNLMKAKSLLYVIVHNACVDKLRSPQLLKVRYADYQLDISEDSLFDLEYRDAERMRTIEKLIQLVDLLPEKSQRIIKAHFFDNMPLKEYARLNNIDEQSARNLLTHAKNKLREMLAERNSPNWLLIWLLLEVAWKN